MKAFVIMPFAEEFDDIYVLGIKETAKKLGVNAYRLDEELFDEGMLDKIYKDIQAADFIIADLSDKNPNVFYELGYAHAHNKLCLLITKEAENIPFDLKHKRHIVYNGSISMLKEKLTENIKWAKLTLEEYNRSPFDVSLEIGGYLNNTEDFSEANVHFKIEIDNKSGKSAPAIEGLFLHSVQEWDIKQDKKAVPSRKSKIKPFNHKYNLNIVNSKIAAGGWTHLEVAATRYVADKWEGDTIEDSYTFGGTILIEIVTAKGTFNTSIPIHHTIDSFPF